MPFASVWPAWIVYVKLSAVVPLPAWYVACTAVPPMFSVSVGTPPLVTTFTASLNVTVAVTTSPAFKVLFCAPVALVSATPLTVGALVSTVSVKAALCAPTLPAASTQA